ncbi:VWA domain-containing protein [Pleionea sediminis]|uniref:VWA domain-containing protein n=1 Tax=Pleionea sediminis TaxID=2569479 RepID=UPI0013DDDDC5|nr:VWA domain-containing protein [Pleionea sediminis]
MQHNKAVRFSAELDSQQLIAGKDEAEISCHVKILPTQLSQDQAFQSARINICLVFDCSTSMTGKMFESAIQTAKNIVDSLHDRHRLSLVAFNTKSHIVFQDEFPIDSQKSLIKNKIEDIRKYLNGTTNMAAGIRSAMDIFAPNTNDAKVIILLSDGTPNCAQEAQDAAIEASTQGVQIYAVGMGTMFQAEQLLRLVTPSNGAVFGDSDERKISNIFQHIIERIDRIFITDAKLSFGVNPNVRIKQLIKTSPERAVYDVSHESNDGLLDIYIGNIEDNKRYEFLLQLEVGSQDEGHVELLSTLLHYHDGSPFLEKKHLSVEFTKNPLEEKERNSDHENAIRSASLAHLSDMLGKACNQLDFNNALEIIDQIQQQFSEQELENVSVHLNNIKENLESQSKISGKLLNDFLVASSRTPEISPLNIDSEEAPTERDTDAESSTPDVQETVDSDRETIALQDEPVSIETSDESINVDKSEEAKSFDIILNDPGDQLILLARIIRDATDMGMRDIVGSIKTRNSLLALDFKSKTDAEEFQQKLTKIGAKSSIQARL